jgi:hypothetical protein
MNTTLVLKNEIISVVKRTALKKEAVRLLQNIDKFLYMVPYPRRLNLHECSI